MKRPRGKAGSNLRLPESVLGEIKSGHSESDNHNITYQNKFKSRKEERKKKRQKIKQKNIKRNAAKSSTPTPVENSKPRPKPKKKDDKEKKEKKAPIIPEDENQMSRAEFEEERYMQLLEKRLKIKSTNFLNSFSEDGLDFLLEGFKLGSKKLRKDPNDAKKNAKQVDNFENDELNSNDTENEDDDNFEDDESEVNSIAGDENDEDDEEFSDEEDGFGNEDEDENENEESENESGDPENEKLNVDAEEPKPIASIVSKYVPPHLRQSNDENAKIKKLVQGLINRLAENSLESTLLEIDGFYRDYSRNSVSTSVTETVLLSISNHSHLSDSLVVVNSGLVAGLYRIAGIEFAANFVQSTVERFNQYHKENKVQASSNGQSGDIGKECSNLISLISELYNFNVIACNLIYDLIRMFLGSINEQNVELLLKLLRSIGHQLRSDDPTAMKEIYLMAATEMKNHPTLAQKSRVKFMMETMSDLKNNKLKKQGTINSGDSIMQRIKTFLKNLEKKFNRGSIEALRVSLDDINNVKTKGKWWLVGASWVGVQYDPNESKPKSDQHMTDQNKNTNELSQLAKQQSMNTEIRKAIFTVLMSSNDFIDAYERIMKLNLTSVQQREIVRVLAHCCGNEKIYNPFYKFVCAKFCQYDHSYKITLQYCLWDFCRELGDNSVGGMGYHSETTHNNPRKKVPLRKIHHMSKFYGDLMAQGALSINAFKGLTLTKIQMIPNAKLFFILFFCQYLSQALENEDNQQLLINGLTNLSAANPTILQEITLFLNLHITNSEIFDQLNQSEKTKISQAVTLVNTAERSKITRLID